VEEGEGAANVRQYVSVREVEYRPPSRECRDFMKKAFGKGKTLSRPYRQDICSAESDREGVTRLIDQREQIKGKRSAMSGPKGGWAHNGQENPV